MHSNILILLISYAIVFAPGCRNRSADSSVKTTTSQMTKKDEEKLSGAEAELVKALKQQKFSIVYEDGEPASYSNFKSFYKTKDKFYFVDESSPQGKKLMFHVNLNPKKKRGNRYFDAVENDQASHLGMTVSMWKRMADGGRGELISQQTENVEIGQQSSSFTKSFKAGFSSLLTKLASDAQDQFRPNYSKIFNRILWGTAAVAIAGIFIAIAWGMLSSNATAGMSGPYALIFASFIGAGGVIVAIITVLVRGAMDMFNWNKPAIEAFPSFRVQ